MDKDKMNNCCCGNDDHHDHDCGCEGEHEHDALLVDLEDEEGNVVTCEIVDAFNYKENDYVLAEDPEGESVYLFKVVGDSEEGELENLSDEEFEEVRAYYESIQE